MYLANRPFCRACDKVKMWALQRVNRRDYKNNPEYVPMLEFEEPQAPKRRGAGCGYPATNISQFSPGLGIVIDFDDLFVLWECSSSSGEYGIAEL